MAKDPLFEQQLNDAKKLLKDLNDIRMQLGRDPIKLTDPESVKQLKSLPSDIRDARKALDEMDGSASNLYSRLKAVTSEFKNQTSETANIRKGFRALTSIVEDLKFEEAGISDLNTKQLISLHKRAKLERGRIEQSSKSLIQNNNLLDQLDDQVAFLREMGTDQSKINDFISEELKFINDKLGKNEKLSDEAKAMLQSYYDQENTVDAIVEKTQERLDLERAIDKKVSGFTFMKDLTESIPGLRVFSKPFQDAEDAARSAVKTAKAAGKNQTMASMGAGFGSIVKSLSKALGPALILGKIIQLIVQALIGANENMVAIAKNLGISATAAEKIRQEFVDIAAESDNILVTSKSLLQAQNDITKALGATTIGSRELSEAQVFLTKNLGLSADKAADMLILFNAQGDSVSEVFNRTRESANAQAIQNGFLISAQEIMSGMANASAEVQANYGFQADALAKAVFQTRKLGLNLTAAQSVSKSLLNFESSIAGELELELLTSRQMNFERARALAATGDIAGATQEVMEQMMSLTDEQMKSPIILQAAAAASGLSVEQLVRARLIQRNLNKETKNYVSDLRAAGREKSAAMAEELGLQGMSEEQIKKTITAQDAFNAAIEKAKDSFTGLVSSNALQILTDSIIEFANFVARFSGNGIKYISEKTDAASKSVTGTIKRTDDSMIAELLGSAELKNFREKEEEARKAASTATVLENMPSLGTSSFGTNLISRLFYRDKARAASEEAKLAAEAVKNYGLDKEPSTFDDFILRPGQKPIRYNKDDLIMGGTSLDMPAKKDYEIDIDSFKPVLNTTVNTDSKVSEKTNMLLEKLISAVKSGGDVYIDGNKAGRAMVLGQHKLS